MKQKPKKPARSEPAANLQTMTSPAADEMEPTAEMRPAPTALIFLCGLLVFVGGLYLDRAAGEFSPQVYEEFATVQQMKSATPVAGVAQRIDTGRELYSMSCGACHQPTGLGTPATFPPLARSEWVLANNPARIIRIALQGFSGPVTVEGKPFNNVMPPWSKDFGGVFTDEQLADILTYVRQEWGNKAPPVSIDQVRKIHQQVGAHPAWTAPELQQVPIP